MASARPRPIGTSTVVSLVLLTASVWLWTCRFVTLRESADGLTNAFASRGFIYLKHRTARDFSMERAVPTESWQLLGFGRLTGVRADGASETWRWFHVWPVALFSAVLPVRAAVRHFGDRRREARRAAGLCVRCGYDRRATPGRCPECGADAEDSRAAENSRSPGEREG
jgi:hypothetical protein